MAVYRLYDSQGDLAAEMASAVVVAETMSRSLRALCITQFFSHFTFFTVVYYANRAYAYGMLRLVTISFM